MRVFAARLLARREYAVRELHDRLLRKWPDGDDIETRVAGFIQLLVEEGLLSDERYVEAFVRSRVQRHQGPVKIRAELRKRGAPDDISERHLQAFSEEWPRFAEEWLARQLDHDLDYEQRGKYYRRLMNRGFTHQQAMDAVSRYAAE